MLTCDWLVDILVTLQAWLVVCTYCSSTCYITQNFATKCKTANSNSHLILVPCFSKLRHNELCSTGQVKRQINVYIYFPDINTPYSFKCEPNHFQFFCVQKLLLTYSSIITGVNTAGEVAYWLSVQSTYYCNSSASTFYTSYKHDVEFCTASHSWLITLCTYLPHIWHVVLFWPKHLDSGTCTAGLLVLGLVMLPLLSVL